MINHLKTLSDKEYQINAWVKHDFPEGVKYDCLDFLIHFFFDDTSIAENPQSNIGVFFINEKEASSVTKVLTLLSSLIDELGNADDQTYINSPVWDKVVKEATIAYKTCTEPTLSV